MSDRKYRFISETSMKSIATKICYPLLGQHARFTCGARISAGLLMMTALTGAFAQTAPKYLISANTTLTTPSGFGGPNGNLATDQFGNLFVPDAAQSVV